jgi:di/tricarboxylate transporter
MGPGHYRFGDFVVAGLPLVILLWLAFSAFVPWYYGV